MQHCDKAWCKKDRMSRRAALRAMSFVESSSNMGYITDPWDTRPILHAKHTTVGKFSRS